MKEEFNYNQSDRWDILEKAKWKELCGKRDTTQIKVLWWKECMWSSLPASKFAQDCYNVLYTRVNSYEKENHIKCGSYGGDDSFSDLLWHIIGLGRDVFNEIMDDPTKLNNYSDYVESFSYVMIDTHDVDKFDHYYHQEKAYECLGILWHMKKQGYEIPNNSKIMNELETRFSHLVEGNVKKACGDFKDWRKKKKNVYDKYYNWENNNHHARFSNTLNDAYNYLIIEE